MKTTWIAVALALLAGCAKKAPEPVVNLSGFELGGSAEQVMQSTPDWKSITIGGVASLLLVLQLGGAYLAIGLGALVSAPLFVFADGLGYWLTRTQRR